MNRRFVLAAGGTVCRVESSTHRDYAAGDLVVAYNGWQDYAISNGAVLTKLSAGMARPSQAG